MGGGMSLEKRVARHGEVEVTLIRRENFILFTPMLHEVASGDLYPGDIINPLRRILRNVKFVEAEAQAIDLPARRARCHGGQFRVTPETPSARLPAPRGAGHKHFHSPRSCPRARQTSKQL